MSHFFFIAGMSDRPALVAASIRRLQTVFAAVHSIADDRPSSLAQLDTDLMLAAGLQNHAHDGMLLPGLHDGIFRHRNLPLSDLAGRMNLRAGSTARST